MKIYSISIQSAHIYETLIEANTPQEAEDAARRMMTYNSIPVVADGYQADEEILPGQRTTERVRDDLTQEEIDCLKETADALQEIADMA